MDQGEQEMAEKQDQRDTERSCRHGRAWTQGCRQCRDDALERARLEDMEQSARAAGLEL